MIRHQASKSIQDIVKLYDLELEEYQVYTEDGYILIMHRIKSDKNILGPVVYFQHGLMASSESFMLNGANSLPFLIANSGYDVWLGNNRGNIYG